VRPDLIVLVPVYNEAERIHEVVRGIVEVLSGVGVVFRVLVLDDGSTDWTEGLQRRLRSHAAIEIRRFAPNRGKGAVLASAIPALEGDTAVVIDADGEYAPADIPAIVAPLADGRADWVIGSRYGFGRPRPRQYVATWLVNRLVNAWFHTLSGVQLQDLLSGLYGFRTSAVADLTLREARFSYTAELLWHVQRRSLRIVEVPVSYRFRTYAEGKKIHWWETLTILAALLRHRSGPRRPRRGAA
jgi:glycosyltransferase involved in cell wall biosynthesis